MIIYCDIDGTLTDSGASAWGKVDTDVLNEVKAAIAAGHTVILWSARGEEYAKSFADRYSICPYACLSKPEVIIDDDPNIRPKHRMPLLSPTQVHSGELKRILGL